MTYDEFLSALRETPREWRLAGGRIRDRDGCCPIEALYYRLVVSPALVPEESTVEEAARAMGLDTLSAMRIVDAADAVWSAQKGDRTELLRACGLAAEGGDA